MRFFAGLLAYLVGLSAIISIGVIGLMALQSPVEQTPSSPTVAVESHKESLTKPVKQTIVGHHKDSPNQKHKKLQAPHKTATPDNKHKKVHVTRKRTLQPPTIDAG